MSTLEQRRAAQRRQETEDSTLTLLRELFAALRELVGEWRRRANGRNALARLSEYDLRDIGVTRAEIERECQKPFWRA